MCCAHYFTECLVARYFESGVVCIFIRYTTIELPNCFFKLYMFILSLFVIAVRFSVVTHQRDLLSSCSPHASCSSRQYTYYFPICFVSDSQTLCNILLYAGVHSCYVIIYRESWLKIPYLLCLVFIRRTSSTFLCFL